MNATLTASGLLVLSALVPAAHAPGGQRIAFRAVQDGSVSKTFDLEMELELVENEMTVTVGGEERPRPQDLSVTQRQTRTIAFTDKWKRVEDGEPRALARSFETIESEMEVEVDGPQGSNSQETEGGSELEGLTVLFAWDADAEEWSASFEEGTEADEALLDELEARSDHTILLPGREVEPDDEWTVEPRAAMAELFFPGGGLAMRLEDGSEDVSTFRRMLGVLEGEFTCTFAGVESGDGGDVAVIKLAAEVEASSEEEGGVDRPEFTGTSRTTTSMELTLEGEMRWSLSASRLARLTLDCEVEVGTENHSEQEHAGTSFEMHAVQKMRGTVRVETVFE